LRAEPYSARRGVTYRFRCPGHRRLRRQQWCSQFGSQQTATTFTDTALVVHKSEVVASSKGADPNLQNPWGVAVATGLPFWIADNNGNLTTFYDGTGVVEPSK